jgi:preprotein translocase subunit SecE
MAKVEVENDQSAGARMMAAPARIVSFFSDVRNEMRKVTFPSRKEVQATTIVVIITVAVFAAYFWVIDLGLGKGIQWLLERGAR